MAADPRSRFLQGRLPRVYEGCNDEEQVFLDLVVAHASVDLGDDASGFASQAGPSMVDDRVDALPSLEMFGAISNVMKTKRNTVKTSISNVR